MYYISREIHTRQYYYNVFTTFHCHYKSVQRQTSLVIFKYTQDRNVSFIYQNS